MDETKLDQNKLLDQLVDKKYYPKDLIEKMKENREKEYPGLRGMDQQTIGGFKGIMESLAGSGLARKAEIQLTILEDIIMNFMNPYTRQLFLTRILKRQSENEVLDKYDSYQESLE
ncbi:MAG: hypothetical protein ACE5OZ_07400 [Candidatus Heimdallarchaeota archaeon]